MAGTATTTYSADIITSHGGVDGGHNDWEYAVPMRQDSFNRRSKSRSSHDSARRSRDRNSKGSRSSSMSRQPYMQDSGYLTSTRGRRDTSSNRKGSETSSSRDVYGHEAASRSAGNVRESGDSYSNKRMNGDNGNWIHRDKLARIESEELHQAAIMFHRRMAADNKRGKNDLSFVTTPPTTEQTEPWPDLQEEQRGYTDSPDPYDGDGVYQSDSERKNWDHRRPGEIASADYDENASSMYSNPALRKSASRIPISTASPAPGSDQNARDARSMSGSKSRRASEPADAADAPGGASRPGSRGVQTKKTPAKGTATNRKTSAPAATRKATPKSRTTSGANGTQRPTTRSGETRPTTALNPPEGDPPWLATMYKPDPRLPPDQQMLPTHAKRMQQEQWAKEGKSGTTYDREFEPIAISPDDMPRPDVKSEKPEAEIENENQNEKEKITERIPQPPQEPEGSTWPLASPEGTRPSTGTGYSPMPKLQEPPPAGLTPKWSPPVVTAQDPPEKEKKGCGCCIVM